MPGKASFMVSFLFQGGLEVPSKSGNEALTQPWAACVYTWAGSQDWVAFMVWGAVSRNGEKVLFYFPLATLSSWGSPWREQPQDLLRQDLSWPTATEPSLFPRVHILGVLTHEPEGSSYKLTPLGLHHKAPAYCWGSAELPCSFLALPCVHFIQGHFLTLEVWQHGWRD